MCKYLVEVSNNRISLWKRYYYCIDAAVKMLNKLELYKEKSLSILPELDLNRCNIKLYIRHCVSYSELHPNSRQYRQIPVSKIQGVIEIC